MLRKKQGLTLLECMVVIAILLILLFSASMSYRDFIHRHQLSTLVNNLIDNLEYARDEAITLDATITLCPKNAGGRCGLHWQKGQLMLNKSNNHILRVLPKMPQSYRLFWRSTLGDSTTLQWQSNGFTRGQQGSFFICARHAPSAQIVILRTGRLRAHIGKIAQCERMI
jgi:type IV fimbrial biogenesis protein FimT